MSNECSLITSLLISDAWEDAGLRDGGVAGGDERREATRIPERAGHLRHRHTGHDTHSTTLNTHTT